MSTTQPNAPQPGSPDPDETRAPAPNSQRARAFPRPPSVRQPGIPFEPPRHPGATPTAPLDALVPQAEPHDLAGAGVPAEGTAFSEEETAQFPAQMAPPPPMAAHPPSVVSAPAPSRKRRRRAALAPPGKVAGAVLEVAPKPRRARRYKPVFVGEIEGATTQATEDSRVALLVFVIVMSLLLVGGAGYFLYQGLIAADTPTPIAGNGSPSTPAQPTPPELDPPGTPTPRDPAEVHADSLAHLQAVHVLLQRRATVMNEAFRLGDASAFEAAWEAYAAESRRLGHVAYWRTMDAAAMQHAEVTTRLLAAVDALQRLYDAGSAPLAQGETTGAPFREVREQYTAIRRLLNEATQHLAE